MQLSAMPRPLAIDIHKLADPVLVALANAERTCCLRAELKTPAWIVAKANQVWNRCRLRRWGCLLLAGGSRSVRTKRTILRNRADSGTKENASYDYTKALKRHEKQTSGERLDCSSLHPVKARTPL